MAGVSTETLFEDVGRVANSVIGATVALPRFDLRFFANQASTMHASLPACEATLEMFLITLQKMEKPPRFFYLIEFILN